MHEGSAISMPARSARRWSKDGSPRESSSATAPTSAVVHRSWAPCRWRVDRITIGERCLSAPTPVSESASATTASSRPGYVMPERSSSCPTAACQGPRVVRDLGGDVPQQPIGRRRVTPSRRWLVDRPQRRPPPQLIPVFAVNGVSGAGFPAPTPDDEHPTMWPRPDSGHVSAQRLTTRSSWDCVPGSAVGGSKGQTARRSEFRLPAAEPAVAVNGTTTGVTT